MAQFHHPELGGMGQWFQGGMTMTGDMFNQALKAKVDGLCSELSQLLLSHGKDSPDEVSLLIPAGSPSTDAWWGSNLGQATASGSQNQIRYAYFSGARRLAIQIGHEIRLYDTGDHVISGISQQQSEDASLTFTSQQGLVRLDQLRLLER